MMEPHNKDLKTLWYALHTRSRFESVVLEGLLGKSLEAFLPLMTVLSKRRDRKKMIKVPMFPGYLFVRTNLEPYEHVEILKTRGAVRLVGSSTGPVPTPDEAIESLKIMVAAQAPLTTGSRYQKGDRVVVVSGPLTGVIGIFSHYKGRDRVVVHVEALSQFAAVEVSRDNVEPLTGQLLYV